MINYSCDRCRQPLEGPIVNGTINIPMPTMKEAERGVELLLPDKSSVGYSFVFAHLCEQCLGELAVWRVNLKPVDQAVVDALRPT